MIAKKKLIVTDFRRWMEKFDFNGKDVSKAAASIGINGRDVASAINQGHRELTMTERLAMAAVRAGLPPWSPETDQEIADAAEFRRLLERTASRSSASAESTEH